MNLDYTFFGFTCMKCNYKCARKSDLHKHFLTKKHQRNVEFHNETKTSILSTNSSEKVEIVKEAIEKNMNK